MKRILQLDFPTGKGVSKLGEWELSPSQAITTVLARTGEIRISQVSGSSVKAQIR